MDDPTSPDAPAAPTAEPAAQPTGRERRRNHHLRALVDEMLASIREAAHHDLWSADERAQYEQELAGIMTRVRGEALADRPVGVPRPSGTAPSGDAAPRTEG
jgi:hypothetical protein